MTWRAISVWPSNQVKGLTKKYCSSEVGPARYECTLEIMFRARYAP